MVPEESEFSQRYRAWLTPPGHLSGEERRLFFTDAMIVLDTNVLLDLYDYTPKAREQVLAALEKASSRLWLPYQVGLEFVRGRHRVVGRRTKALGEAASLINDKLIDARRSILAARTLVQQMLQKYGQDDESFQELDALINQHTVDEMLKEWRDCLLEHARRLKDDQDIALDAVTTNDIIAPAVAALYSDRIGHPPAPELLRSRVQDASAYRFPNQIPPGFADFGKHTPMEAAGDFLLWEELVDQARESRASRVLFVSGDAKSDWYEPAEQGRGPRPSPMLLDELRLRAGAELRLENPRQFYDGIRLFLDAEIEDATSAEIARTSEKLAEESPAEANIITEQDAPLIAPSPKLAIAAYHSAGLSTAAVRRMVESASHWEFQWWLIGVTAEQKRRDSEAGEPAVIISAAVRSELPPAPYWEAAANLNQGEWPIRAASWLAPWFSRAVAAAPESDRHILLRLAARQADFF